MGRWNSHLVEETSCVDRTERLEAWWLRPRPCAGTGQHHRVGADSGGGIVQNHPVHSGDAPPGFRRSTARAYGPSCLLARSGGAGIGFPAGVNCYTLILSPGVFVPGWRDDAAHSSHTRNGPKRGNEEAGGTWAFNDS